MDQSRILLIVRQFWENAIRLLLEDPKNARDLLVLCGADIVKRIDLRRVRLIQTTFVERDYRHGESDVVLLAPLRRERGERMAMASRGLPATSLGAGTLTGDTAKACP